MTDKDEQRVLPPERQAGVCLHITSLPGPFGIGEIGASARQFIDTMKAMQLRVWQFLPLGPTAYGDSPYQPLSTFAGNEMLIDVGDLVAAGYLTDEEAAPLTDLADDFVDYGALIPVKSRLLRKVANRFEQKAGARLRKEFATFVARHDTAWLHDYALYRLLKTKHDERPWPEWDPRYVHRDPQTMAELAERESAEIAAIKVIQYLFHRQWSALRQYAHEQGITLFGDLPIYIALDSADAWAHPEILNIDRDGRPEAVAGVPPDYFSADGQLWGNPLYDWDAHAANHYRWWVDRLRSAIELADIVRIDHFRGFEGYWSVPAGSKTARNGAWMPGPGDAIFDAMRDALGSLPIVAENLGVITPAVEALRERHRMPGMIVLQFDVADADFELDGVETNCVVYTGTHDNDTTVGWFAGSPNDIRSDAEIRETQQAALRITGGTPETIHDDMIRAAFSTDALLAIAPLQDYLGLGSEARMNVPGTTGNNWRWRVPGPQLSASVCRHVADLVVASGR